MPVTSVPFDPELRDFLAEMQRRVPSVPLSLETLAIARTGAAAMASPVAEVIAGLGIEHEERRIPGPLGAPDLEVSILRPIGKRGPVPALYNIHGGGLVMGTRFMDTPRLAALVAELGVVAVNVEYRLAPEHPGDTAVEDCYAGLAWTAKNAVALGIDASRLIVMGGSAGGCLSAGVALLARDRGGPALAGQLLLTPMLDDRNQTVSSHQYDGVGTWDRSANIFCWHAVLGEDVGGPHVSPYVAPARATDLSNLPPAYIELGSAELFRDEGVDYASRIWAAGGEAELHVWNGGFHGFDMFCPSSTLTVDALQARSSWLRRVLRQ